MLHFIKRDGKQYRNFYFIYYYFSLPSTLLNVSSAIRLPYKFLQVSDSGYSHILIRILSLYKSSIFISALFYLFLLMILLSYLPVSISIYLTNKDTLLSSFRLFQRSSANSSISSGIATSFGSPSKLGSGFPSHL